MLQHLCCLLTKYCRDWSEFQKVFADIEGYTVYFLLGHCVYLYEMVMVLCADEYLDRVENLVSSINSYGSLLSAEEQQRLSGSGPLALHQQVLARSCVNGGQWRNASVIGNRYTFY